jgi:hypothetical protein
MLIYLHQQPEINTHSHPVSLSFFFTTKQMSVSWEEFSEVFVTMKTLATLTGWKEKIGKHEFFLFLRICKFH